MIPMVPTRRVIRLRACVLKSKPSPSAISRTRLRVFSGIRDDSFRLLETVAMLTPAALATSLSVISLQTFASIRSCSKAFVFICQARIKSAAPPPKCPE